MKRETKVENARRSVLIKAYIVPKRGEKPTEAEILAFARSRLPETSIPDTIEFRSELPKTFVGKVFKRKLLAEEQPTDWKTDKRISG